LPQVANCAAYASLQVPPLNAISVRVPEQGTFRYRFVVHDPVAQKFNTPTAQTFSIVPAQMRRLRMRKIFRIEIREPAPPRKGRGPKVKAYLTTRLAIRTITKNVAIVTTIGATTPNAVSAPVAMLVASVDA